MTSTRSISEGLELVASKYVGEAELQGFQEAALARLSWRLRHSGKTCSKCQEEKPLSAFTRDGQRPDGLSPWCRECHSLRRASR